MKKEGVTKKGPWTPEEDNLLLSYIQLHHGHGSWQALPSKAGLKRCGKSCRLRWNNYLRPDIKRGKFNIQEENSIIQLHALLGNKWSAIANHLPKRTDNEIKNYWNTHLKKKLEKMGIDPTTHKPKSIHSSSSSPNLRHMAQWETARLEAEARLVRQSNVQSFTFSNSLFFPHRHHSTTAPPPPPPPHPHPNCLDVLKAWQGMVFGLESPTSTLNFPPPPPPQLITKNIIPPPVVQIDHEQVGETLILDDHEIINTLNENDNNINIINDDNAWNINNYGNEYISDVFVFNSSESEEAMGAAAAEGDHNVINLEDNYWNCLQSLVDAPLLGVNSPLL